MSEAEVFKNRMASRDALFAEIARDLGAVRDIAQAGQFAAEELAASIAAVINKALAAPAVADAPKAPESAPAPAPAEMSDVPEVPDDHVPNNHAPDVPHDEPKEDHG